MAKEKEMSFEESINRLKEISELLEKQEIDIDTSIKLYEEGILLAKNCYKQLKEAELKITNLKEQLKEEISD